ncbi:hypothetical protein GBAR_LOCUS20348 [Geodia barretti]|uniref:Uncharacterized protein n=1 Tax=Geodia barretti TaxID=519541 RepID=A0AA35SV53_GEOBA|nr:hypothetical protein GBAR_LOCUS20348 [Geodia barretti]
MRAAVASTDHVGERQAVFHERLVVWKATSTATSSVVPAAKMTLSWIPPRRRLKVRTKLRTPPSKRNVISLCGQCVSSCQSLRRRIVRPWFRYAISRNLVVTPSQSYATSGNTLLSGNQVTLVPFPGRSDDVCLRCDMSLTVIPRSKRCEIDVSITPHFNHRPLGQRVHYRGADAMQAAGNLIALATEFTSGVKGSHYRF